MSYFKDFKVTQTQKIRERKVITSWFMPKLWSFRILKSNMRNSVLVIIFSIQILSSFVAFPLDVARGILRLLFLIIIPFIIFLIIDALVWTGGLFGGFFKKALAILGIIWALYFAWKIYQLGISDATTKTIVQAQAVFSELGLLFKTLFSGAWEFLKGLVYDKNTMLGR